MSAVARTGGHDVELEALGRRALDEIWNQQRLDVADELISPEFRGYVGSFGELRGPAGVRELAAAYHTAFPDLQISIEDLIVHDDTVITRWRATGTHRGDLLGLAPTGRAATGRGINIDRWLNGQVVESWSESNQLDLLQQLGVIPAPGSARDRLGKRIHRIAVAISRLRDRQRRRARTTG